MNDPIENIIARGSLVDADARSPVGPPRSASGFFTGAAGAATALLAGYLLRDWLEPSWFKALVVLALAAAAMLAMDLLFYRSHRSPSTGLARQPLRPFNPRRVLQKLVGFWSTIGALAATYWLLPEYAAPLYRPFEQAAWACLPAVLLLSPVYVVYVDRRQRDPDDSYAQLGRLLLGGPVPSDWMALRRYALGWVVKGFFLPLMFSYAVTDLSTVWSRAFLPTSLSFSEIFDRLIDLFYLVDVLLASIAYALTFRLTDTHMRSVEPSVGGWVVCLVCYQPFANSVGGTYFLYDQDKLDWGAVFGPYPWLYVVWGSLILVLVFVYVWSTAAFGLRFSNLTHRGIITSGPYRWLKHPAYVSKNLSWWMISVPFVSTRGWSGALQCCLLLAGANLIYFFRASTEERHLSTDPVYRAYTAFIDQHGLFAVLRRAFQGIARRLGPAASTRQPT